MNRRLTIVILFLLAAFGPLKLKASDWKYLVDLKGNWWFTVGDDPSWADPATDISDWDKISAPRAWEYYYEGYNGYGWYRKNFNIQSLPAAGNVILYLGYIDDVDEVFINGKKVGQTGKFPPHFRSAYNVERQYAVPVSLLKTENNVIAVRVFDEAMDGGMIRADKFGLYDDKDQSLMSVDLSGTWKFSIDNFGHMNSPETDDRNWADIYVPMKWDNQGYSDFDGTAWYHKRFTMPDNLKGQELYLVLGKIDDFDKVYLNGEKIGQVEDLDGYSRFNRGNAWTLYRIYKIPMNIVRSKNLISVEVTDTQLDGGIYEGPVGITTADEVKRFREKNNQPQPDDSFNSFLRDLLRLFD
ncbi:MAG TPA: beta galactosidase jelly roll domain-containing protein [Sunxiuqinia sp.]|nr:beta galactosidase jelly roll domain-containing protein [Sunxiuqinia sp.]